MLTQPLVICVQRILKRYARGYQQRMEQLVHSDVAVLELQRLQDLLGSSTVAPDNPLHTPWDHRLSGLLARRERHLQVGRCTTP